MFRRRNSASAAATRRTVALAAWCLLLPLIASQAGPQQTNDAGRAGESPQLVHDFDHFKVETFYNTTKFDDKLRLSKSHFKFVFSSELLPRILRRTSVKISELEELVRCESLQLERPKVQTLVECAPLESHVSEEDQLAKQPSGTAAGHYAKRHSIRARFSSNLVSLIPHLNQNDLKVLPLRADFVAEQIRAVLAANKLAGFGSSAASQEFQSGYYFEWRLAADVQCSGSVLLAVNQTRAFADSAPLDPHLGRSPYPANMRHLSHLLAMMQENGGLVSVLDSTCLSQALKPNFAGLGGEFTLISRKQFPFLTMRQTIYSLPYRLLLDYSARLTQARAADAPEHKYNQTVEIKSGSFLPWLSFKLVHMFVAGDEPSEGLTFSRFASASNFHAIFEKHWSSKHKLDRMKLFNSSMKPIRQGPVAIYSVEDNLDSDYVELKLNMILNPGTGKPFTAHSRPEGPRATGAPETRPPKLILRLPGEGPVEVFLHDEL